MEAAGTSEPKRSWLRHLLAIGLLLLLSLVGYGHLLRRDTLPYSPYSDVLAYHLATKMVLHQSLQAGQGIPFWRSDQFSGNAALINPQSQFTYPLHLPFLFLPPADAIGMVFWVHFLAAGLAFYFLGGAFLLGLWPRLLMAVAGMFSVKLILATYAGWLSIVPGISLAPALIAAVVCLASRPRLGSAITLAALGALCLHTGHLQMFYYAVLFSAIYLMVQGVGLWRRRSLSRLAPTLGWLTLGTVLAVAMVGYLFLPLFGEVSWISRAEASYEFHTAGGTVGPPHLLTLFHPEALGTPLDGSYPELWEKEAYFGIIPLLLAVAGVVLGWRRSPTRFMVGGFAVALLLSMDTPLSRLGYYVIPGYRLFRLPCRLLFVCATCGIVLAGVGLEETLRRLSRFGRARRISAVVGIGLIALIAFEGTLYSHRYLATKPQAELAPKLAYRDVFAADRDLYRVAPLDWRIISVGWSSPLKLQLVTGYDPYNYRRYVRYFDLLRAGDSRGGSRVWLDLDRIRRWDLLDQLNVKYLAAREPIREAPEGRLERVANYADQPMFVFYVGMRTGPVQLYRNHGFTPRVRWAKELIPVADESQAIEQIRISDLDNKTVVECPRGSSPVNRPDPRDRVHLVSWAPGRLAIQTQSLQPRVVLVSEVYHPGWQARLDGAEVEVLAANLTLLGVSVPAGEHRLDLEFQPLLWKPALAITALGLVTFVGLFLVWLRRRFRREVDHA